MFLKTTQISPPQNNDWLDPFLKTTLQHKKEPYYKTQILINDYVTTLVHQL